MLLTKGCDAEQARKYCESLAPGRAALWAHRISAEEDVIAEIIEDARAKGADLLSPYSDMDAAEVTLLRHLAAEDVEFLLSRMTEQERQVLLVAVDTDLNRGLEMCRDILSQAKGEELRRQATESRPGEAAVAWLFRSEFVAKDLYSSMAKEEIDAMIEKAVDTLVGRPLPRANWAGNTTVMMLNGVNLEMNPPIPGTAPGTVDFKGRFGAWKDTLTINASPKFIKPAEIVLTPSANAVVVQTVQMEDKKKG